MLVGLGGEAGRAEARAIALAEPERVEALVDLLAEATIPLPGHAGAGRRPGAADLRDLGRGAAGATLFERLVIAPHARDRREGCARPASTVPIIGFPRGAAPGLVERYAAGDRRAGRGAGHPGAAGARPAAAGERGDPGRARSGCCCGPAARRWTRAGRRSCSSSGRAGPTSSTSATASCPTRRSSTSRAVVEQVTALAQADDAAGGSRSCCSTSAVRTARRRCGRSCSTCSPTRRSSALPALAALAARRADLAGCASAGGEANYAVMGGASPLNAGDAGPGRRAGGGARQAAARRRDARLHRHALLAPAHRRDGRGEVAAFAPDEIVLLPLYPQYSTTTTASSLAAWRRAYAGPGRAADRLLLLRRAGPGRRPRRR